MPRLGNGNMPVRRHWSMAASISGVHIKSGLSGEPALDWAAGASLYGQRILCFVQLRLEEE